MSNTNPIQIFADSQAIQCSPFHLNWTGGIPPYVASVVLQPENVFRQFPLQTDTFLDWIVDFAFNQQISFRVVGGVGLSNTTFVAPSVGPGLIVDLGTTSDCVNPNASASPGPEQRIATQSSPSSSSSSIGAGIPSTLSSSSPGPSRTRQTGLIIAITVPCVILVISMLSAAIFLLRRRRRQTSEQTLSKSHYGRVLPRNSEEATAADIPQAVTFSIQAPYSQGPVREAGSQTGVTYESQPPAYDNLLPLEVDRPEMEMDQGIEMGQPAEGSDGSSYTTESEGTGLSDQSTTSARDSQRDTVGGAPRLLSKRSAIARLKN